jgi:hypothetical protein
MNKYLDEDNDDTYDVDSYTERELFDILDLFNPSDRELEAKILLYIRKYEDIDTPDARKLLRFFHQIYQRFFEVEVESYLRFLVELRAGFSILRYFGL